MEFTPPLVPARLVRRYKRFLADVILGGEPVTVHCPDPGAMRGCTEPGSTVWLSHSARAGRKYPWTWEQATTAEGVVVGINTARSNALVREALESGLIQPLGGYTGIRSEVPYGEEGSRADFLLSGHPGAADCILEVKNVTASSGNGVALFPDSVSVRGTRHLRELMGRVRAGQRAALVYCVQRDDVCRVRPADEIDPQYARTLRAALAAGVEVTAWVARVGPRETILYREAEVMPGADSRWPP